MSLQTFSCPICNGKLFYDIRPATYSYREKSVTVNQPGQYCETCGECFMSKSDMEDSCDAIQMMFNYYDLLPLPQR